MGFQAREPSAAVEEDAEKGEENSGSSKVR